MERNQSAPKIVNVLNDVRVQSLTPEQELIDSPCVQRLLPA